MHSNFAVAYHHLPVRISLLCLFTYTQQKQKDYFNSGTVISVATYLTPEMWPQTEPPLHHFLTTIGLE